MTTAEELEAARDALKIWDKFAWYATGKSGHSALEMPLWYALVFEEAVKAGRAVLLVTAPEIDEP